MVWSDQVKIDKDCFSGTKHQVLINEAQDYSLLKFLSFQILLRDIFIWIILVQLIINWHADFYK